MEKERSNTPHYWIRAIILLGFTFYITHLVSTGNIIYYIAPRMTPYVKYASILLFGIAIFQVYLALQSNREDNDEEACDCEHVPSRSIFINIGTYSLFILPLLMGFMMPDMAMGSSVASQKGMNLSADQSMSQTVATSQTTKMPVAFVEEDAVLAELFQSDTYTKDYALLGMRLYKQDLITIEEEGFMELLTSIDLYRENFIGKKIKMTGFVYREDDMLPNQFVISRLAMQCCSADTAPYGIMVESDIANKFAEDTWVEVTGVIGQTTYNDNQIMEIEALTLVTTVASETPYIYPYFDDFINLGN
jgi:putative membrane protein